jgi:hypothetical protein
LDKIFKKYAWIGLLTFIPIIITGYYMLDIFGNYWNALMNRNYLAKFDISSNRDQGLVIGGIVLLLIFFAYFTASYSSSLYILAHFKQKEKWLLWGHKFRVITWIPIILGGLIILGIFSMVAIKES